MLKEQNKSEIRTCATIKDISLNCSYRGYMIKNNEDALYNWEEIRQIYGENKGQPYTIDKDSRLRFPDWTVGKKTRIYVKNDSGECIEMIYTVPTYGRIRLPVWTKNRIAKIYVRVEDGDSTGSDIKEIPN